MPATRRLDPDGGLPARPVTVRHDVAEIRHVGTPAAQGDTIAWPEVAHSARVTLANLQPDRPHSHRFIAGGERSPSDRATTRATWRTEGGRTFQQS